MKTILNWLLGIEHDVETIVANFSSTVAKLEARAEAQMKARLEAIDAAVFHNAVADAALVEAEKAKAVAAKIGALLS